MCMYDNDRKTDREKKTDGETETEREKSPICKLGNIERYILVM